MASSRKVDLSVYSDDAADLVSRFFALFFFRKKKGFFTGFRL